MRSNSNSRSILRHGDSSIYLKICSHAASVASARMNRFILWQPSLLTISPRKPFNSSLVLVLIGCDNFEPNVRWSPNIRWSIGCEQRSWEWHFSLRQGIILTASAKRGLLFASRLNNLFCTRRTLAIHFHSQVTAASRTIKLTMRKIKIRRQKGAAKISLEQIRCKLLCMHREADNFSHLNEWKWWSWFWNKWRDDNEAQSERVCGSNSGGVQWWAGTFTDFQFCIPNEKKKCTINGEMYHFSHIPRLLSRSLSLCVYLCCWLLLLL